MKFKKTLNSTDQKFAPALLESISIVFEKLGGINAMAEWAAKYPTEFYKMYVKVLDACAKERTPKDEIIIEGKAKDL